MLLPRMLGATRELKRVEMTGTPLRLAKVKRRLRGSTSLSA